MKLIKEFSEFGHMRLGSGDSVPQSTHVNNPQLSLGDYNRFQSQIDTSMDKLNNLYRNISLTSTGFNLKSGNAIEASDIKNIKILRIYPKDDIYLNVYFTFELEEKEYYGVIKKINHQNPEVYCEIFNDRTVYSSREWTIRVKGNIIKVIKKWMQVDRGEYITLKDIDANNLNTGELTLIPSNIVVSVVKSTDDCINIIYNNENYQLTGQNYYYFNYYFQPKSED